MNLQGIKRRIAKILVYSVTGLIFLLIYSFLILQIPAVQKVIARQLLGNISEVIGFKTTIQSMRFSWFDRLVINGITIEDPEHNQMITVNRLVVNYKIKSLFQDRDLNIDAVEVDSARVYFAKIIEGDSQNLNINVFINRINDHYGKSGGRAPRINIGEALVNRSQFSLDNNGKDSLSGFDYNHFTVLINNAELQNFMALGDTVQFAVNSLKAKDKKTNFGIHQLSTFFRISQAALEFQGISLNAGRSYIADTVIFKYDSQLALNDFVHQVDVHAHLVNTIIHPEDLALFAPAANRLKLPVNISGTAQGRVDNFRMNEMKLVTGTTRLEGAISMDGLPDFNETFIVLKLKNSRLLFADIDFLFNDNTNQRLEALGALTMNAEFLGYPNDFVAKGDFSNQLGRIVSDINLKIDEKSFEQSKYRGQLSLQNFDIGSYLNDTLTFQKASLTGQITGSGFTASTAKFKLVSTITSIGVLGYNYTNIRTDATFESQFFNGDLTINDPNIKINATGSIDLRNQQNSIQVQAKIDTLHLHKIRFTKKKLSVHADVNMNMKGFVLDSLSGDAHVRNLTLNYDNQWLALDSLTLTARKEGRQRSLSLQSDLADIKAEGDFYFSRLYSDLRTLINEFYLNLKNDKETLLEYYATKKYTEDKYEANFDIQLKGIKPVTNLLNIDLQVGKDIAIEGKFVQGNTTIIKAFTKIDSLQYQDILLENSEIEINASKRSDNPDVLVMAYFTSAQQTIGNLQTKNLITEAIWDKEHIDFYVNLDQQSRNNNLRLTGMVDLSDSTKIKLSNTSKIQLLEKIWTIDTHNSIAVRGKEWSIRNFTWFNEEQVVELEGFVSVNPQRALTLRVQQFNLATLNSISQRQLSGTVNARVLVSDLYQQATLQNEIDITGFMVDEFLVGDVIGKNVWNHAENKFIIEFLIDRLATRIVNCSGYYNPSDKTNPLFIKASLEKANLKIIEPFIDEILSHMDGTISGTYFITGTPGQPRLNGKGKIDQGQLMVNYLKTTYQISGNVGLTPTSIYFENIELTDALRNKGQLQGEITHKNFNQMQIDMTARFDKFHVLNTSARDNSLFYGQGYATGDVSFTGPLNNLKISANATTERYTRISIPMSSRTATENKDFMNFVNFNDSTYQAGVEVEKTKKINLTGVTFDLNLDVNPNAYCEIIFDIKAGDILHGRGNGKIKLQLDTKGEFNMFGPVVFTQGGYNFTLYDIINKEFSIEPGSSISWYGDPYQGVMQIKASYNQLASFAPILADPTLSTVPQIRRKYPVQVLLKLNGSMLSPDFEFDITARDLPKSIPVEGGKPDVRLEFEFEAFKNKIDEQELKRQVFSLIVLRKFSPPESFNTSGSIVSSVSELFTNQLSYWVNQVDENLEIDVDLGTLDQESFNAFQLRLSYSFFNGRLRITRDGTLGNQTGATTPDGNRSDFSTVAGDWTVDYLLTADGKFRVKMYSRANVNNINNNLSTQNPLTTGVSLTYTQSFNELKDLLRRSRDKNRRKPEEEEPEPTEEDTNENDGSD
jgi:hypothetical protein